MKTATRALFLFWVVCLLAITAALFLSTHYEEASRQCQAQGLDRVHGTCQGVTP